MQSASSKARVQSSSSAAKLAIRMQRPSSASVSAIDRATRRGVSGSREAGFAITGERTASGAISASRLGIGIEPARRTAVVSKPEILRRGAESSASMGPSSRIASSRSASPVQSSSARRSPSRTSGAVNPVADGS